LRHSATPRYVRRALVGKKKEGIREKTNISYKKSMEEGRGGEGKGGKKRNTYVKMGKKGFCSDGYPSLLSFIILEGERKRGESG